MHGERENPTIGAKATDVVLRLQDAILRYGFRKGFLTWGLLSGDISRVSTGEDPGGLRRGCTKRLLSSWDERSFPSATFEPCNERCDGSRIFCEDGMFLECILKYETLRQIEEEKEPLNGSFGIA